MSRFTKIFIGMCLAGMCGLAVETASAALPVTLLAQDDAAPPAPRGAVIQEQTKSFVVEGIGVAVLFGAALFAICRGSVRGN